MMKLIVVISAWSSVFIGILSFCYQESCGIARWEVKTLSDTAVYRVNPSPKRVTISELNLLPKPIKVSNKQPRFNQEFFTYQVNCKITEFKKEDDGDYHLILQDLEDPTKFMIAEIPDPACAGKSKYKDKFATARTSFEACIVKGGKVKKGLYKIIGTGFFDKIHGAEGAAKNGMELHPVIYFAKFK